MKTLVIHTGKKSQSWLIGLTLAIGVILDLGKLEVLLMRIKLTKDDIELIGNALISYRWKIENNEGHNSEFHQCAALADRLACNHNGGELNFLPPNED